MNPVIKASVQLLVNVPDLVRYGSKPYREIQKNADVEHQIRKHLRSFAEAVNYLPNQVFIGNIPPETLDEIPQPWYQHKENFSPYGKFGKIIDELIFYSFLKAADAHQGDFIWLNERILQFALLALESPKKLEGVRSHTLEEIQTNISEKKSLPLYFNDEIIGCVNRDNSEEGREDDNLSAHLMLENLAAKASGAMALDYLFTYEHTVKKEDVDYIMSCSEEAVGDRYNRGGGNLGKAIGETAGLKNAAGPDIKAFCSAPIYAIIHAAALIKAGVYKNIVVVGGGSLAKIGMKFLYHMHADMPILEDMLGCFAILVSEDDGQSPVIRLDAVGKHDIGAASSQQAIMESLIVKPLERIGLKMTDVDKYATELTIPRLPFPAVRATCLCRITRLLPRWRPVTAKR